jgi:hypothetical protein
MRLIFDAAGITFDTFDGKLPHRAGMQMGFGTQVANLQAAKPGDLVFFGGGWNPYPANGVGHVGMYLGNGMIFEAASSKTGIVIRAVGDRKILGIRSMTGGQGVKNGLVYDPSVQIPPPGDYPDLQIPGGTGTAAQIAEILAQRGPGGTTGGHFDVGARSGGTTMGLKDGGQTIASPVAQAEQSRKDALTAQLSLMTRARAPRAPAGPRLGEDADDEMAESNMATV